MRQEPLRCGRRIHDDMKTLDAKRVLEAALICSSQPMALREMNALFAGEVGNDTLRTLLGELADECKDRAIELVAVASGWRYQSRAEMAPFLARLDPERAPRYSRAVLETLAIIAYRQPVTRGDIEDVRGVAVASSVMKQLEDRGWIEAIGYREAPGRPALLATTKQFLDDLGIASLAQLPILDGADGEPIATIVDGISQGSLSFAESVADAAGDESPPEAPPAAHPPADADALEPHA
jgi:segregation and condensation protein B